MNREVGRHSSGLFLSRDFFLVFALGISFFSPFASGNAKEQNSLENTRPAYCSAENFWKNSESGLDFDRESGVKRMIRFRLGSRHLVGLAVGQSDAFATAGVALKATGSVMDGNYCTWYFNEGNESASTLFNWAYFPKPSSNVWLSPEARKLGWAEIQDLYTLGFYEAIPRMVQCLARHRYLAMGCNGMRERGPTLFGMVLAFAGCTPQEVSAIVNPIWGLGWPLEIVSEKDREDILTQAFLLGNSGVLSEYRMVLQQILASEI